MDGTRKATTPSRVGLAIAMAAAMLVSAGRPDPSAHADGMSFDPAAPRTIVLFDRLPNDLRGRLARVGITHAVSFPTVDAVAIAGPRSAQRAVAGWDGVLDVSPDAPLNLYLEQAVQTTRADLVRMGVKPLKAPYTGRGVTVAIVDTGIDTAHPDLDDGKVVENLDFSPSAIFDPTRGDPTDLGNWRPLIGEPIVTPEGTDTAIHGTLLGGIVGGTGEAALGADLRGVAPEATLVNLDLDGSGTPVISPSSLVAAFEWLLAHRADPRYPGGIRVAVAGMGADCEILCEAPALREAIGRAIAAGIIVVFPTGAAVDGNVTYPARYPEVIAARAACKDQDHVSGMCEGDQAFSSAPRGPSIDVIAPGVFVWAPTPTQKLPCQLNASDPPCTEMWVPGEGNLEHELNNRLWYGFYISHSLAAAHVAGVAALMLQANPTLGQADVERILQQTARDLGPGGFDDRSGHGMVDALLAVRAAEKAAMPGRTKPSEQIR